MTTLITPLLAHVDAVAPLDALINTLLSAIRALPFEWTHELAEALLGTILLAPLCGMVGVFVVNYRMAFFSDAISHSAFSGVAAGLLLTSAGLTWIDPRFTLLALGLAVGILITTVKQRTDLGTDTIIGVAFSAVVALGIMLVTARPQIMKQFSLYLYGDLLLIDVGMLRGVLLLGLATFAYLLWSFNKLTMIGFNGELAETRGTRVRAYDYSFAVLVVLLVTATIPLTGMLLVTALLVVPAATARNMGKTAGQMFWWAAAVGLIAGVGGLSLAYRTNSAAGASIIMIGALLFALSLVWRTAQRR